MYVCCVYLLCIYDIYIYIYIYIYNLILLILIFYENNKTQELLHFHIDFRHFASHLLTVVKTLYHRILLLNT